MDGFPTGNVGKPRWPDDVPRGVNPRDAGFVAVVHVQVTLGIQLEWGRTAGEERGDPDRHEGNIGGECFTRPSRDGDLYSSSGRFCFLHFCTGKDADTLFGEGLLKGNGDLGVLNGKDVGQHLDDSHLGAEGIEEVGKLDADRTCTDDDDFLGLLCQDECMPTTDDARAVKCKAWHLTGDDAGGDEDFLGRERRLLAIGRLDIDNSGLGNARVSLDVVHLVLFKEELDAAG